MQFTLSVFKSVAIALGIVVVFNIFIGVGIQTFYDKPDFEAFCTTDQLQRYTTQDACEAVGGKWFASPTAPVPDRLAPAPVKEAFEPYCDGSFTCRQDYQAVRDIYERNTFIVWVIVGVIALGVGLAIGAAPAVSAGFVYGGVISFIVGTIGYWSQMDDYLRFIVVAVVLAVLVWLGYRKQLTTQ